VNLIYLTVFLSITSHSAHAAKVLEGIYLPKSNEIELLVTYKGGLTEHQFTLSDASLCTEMGRCFNRCYSYLLDDPRGDRGKRAVKRRIRVPAPQYLIDQQKRISIRGEHSAVDIAMPYDGLLCQPDDSGIPES
jgi:hypothetical protein